MGEGDEIREYTDIIEIRFAFFFFLFLWISGLVFFFIFRNTFDESEPLQKHRTVLKNKL